MTGRARRAQHSQRIGPGCLRAGRLRIVAAVIILATCATPASPADARAAHGDADAASASADAVVEKLRDLPLPMRSFQQGIASPKTTRPPLPDLETRRQQVYDELHALGPASVPALARALRDPDPEMRRDVAVALDVLGGGWWQFPDGGAKLDLRPALPALLTALQDSDSGVRGWAARDISDMGAAAATAVPRLRTMLQSPDAESRGTACSALGAIGFPARDSLPDLQHALNDSSPQVQQAARDAITRIDRETALH